MKKSQEKALYSITGWEDFLSEDFLNLTRDFRSFEDAREYVRKLNLSGQKDWSNWGKSGEKPDDIPSNPQKIYKDKGWINWGGWLGTK